MPTLVSVESPAEADKIAGHLGRDAIVETSLGRVRDLPDARRRPSTLPG